MPIETSCSSCGVAFHIPPSRVKHHNFCSRTCANRAQGILINTERMSKPWTVADLNFLRSRYRELGPSGCGKALGRDAKQVSARVVLLGLQSDRSPQVGMTDAWKRRFWSYVEKHEASQCWPWIGNINSHGYGSIRLTTKPGTHKTIGASRVAYELHNSTTVPAGMCVCHHCDNRRCCNPTHLYVGTAQDNVDDREVRGRGRPPFSEKPLRGSDNYAAIMNDATVCWARREARSGRTVSDLARAIGVTAAGMSYAVRGKSWQHLNEVEPPVPSSRIKRCEPS